MPIDGKTRELTFQEYLTVERAEKKKSKEREDDQEARDDINVANRAEDLGLDVRPDGRVFRTKRGPENISEEKKTQRLMDMFLSGAKPGDIVAGIIAVAQTLSTAFAAPASTSARVAVAPNGQQIVFMNDVAVTEATQRAIEQDQAVITTKMERFRAMNRVPQLYEPGERMRFGREIVSLAKEFDMRRHPETKQFVPSMERILDLEELHNPHKTVECTGLVCAFSYNAAGLNSRGIKRAISISDVFDDDDAGEIKHTANERAVEIVKPVIKAPGLHLS